MHGHWLAFFCHFPVHHDLKIYILACWASGARTHVSMPLMGNRPPRGISTRLGGAEKGHLINNSRRSSALHKTFSDSLTLDFRLTRRVEAAGNSGHRNLHLERERGRGRVGKSACQETGRWLHACRFSHELVVHNNRMA